MYRKARCSTSSRQIEIALDSYTRHVARLRLGGVSEGLVTKHIERKLIEDDHQRETACGILQPVIKLAPASLFPGILVTLAQHRIELRRRVEPEFSDLIREPEVEYFLRHPVPRKWPSC